MTLPLRPARLRGALALVFLLVVAPGALRAELVHEDTPPPWLTQPVDRLLYLLGGLRVTGTMGVASIRSAYEDESGERRVVASGSTTNYGFGIALKGPPRKTGLTFGPNIGYLHQNLKLADFRAEIPWASSPDPTVQDLDVACQDPSTGEPVDCGASNVYTVRLRSGYFGVSVGYRFLWRVADVDLFLTLDLAGNFFSLRYAHILIGEDEDKRFVFLPFSSGSARVGTGLYLRPLHAALVLEGKAEVFRPFVFQEAAEFQGPVRYDEAEQIWYRPRIFVDRADLSLYTFRLSLIWVFR